MEDKEKFHTTLKSETADWLRKQYPEADSLSEAARAAIGDARRFWNMIDVEETDGGDEFGK